MNAGSDRILPFTKVVAAIVIPFLWMAFLILYFFPETTGERFAWPIKPALTAMYMGAGYLGGSWVFINALINRRWHRIHGGFWPVTIFTWFMLIATIAYWDRFSHENLGFILWFILYLVTPFLVPAIWFLNQRVASDQPEAHDVIISPVVRWFPRIVGAGTLIFVAASVIDRDFLIQVWPWTLSPLTGLVMCGWIALLAVGAIVMSFEPRWSGWKVPLVSILIWHIPFLVAALTNASDFKDSIVNWYVIAVVVMVAVIIGYYIRMELRSRRSG